MYNNVLHYEDQVILFNSFSKRYLVVNPFLNDLLQSICIGS